MPRLALDAPKEGLRARSPIPQGKLEADSSQPGNLSCYKPRAGKPPVF